MRKLGIFLAFFTSLLTINIATAEEVKSNGFNLIVVGDSQPQTKKQLTELKEVIIPQIGTIIEEYRATSYPTAILITGDIVWDTMRFLPRVKEAFESLGVPVYTVIGNHDHNRFHRYNEERAERNYIKTFGPRNQSFELGETLFLTFDNINYYRSANEEIDSQQLVWLSELMEKTPSDKRVAVCMHASATDFTKGVLKPYIKPLVSILGNREIHFITGHRHHHDTADISERIFEHNVAQVNGNLWYAPIVADGTPRGVFCIEERNGEWQWQHRILGESADKQLIIYPMQRVKEQEEYIVVKVIGWDDKWLLEWSEDGEMKGSMEQIEILDPDYMYYVENEAKYAEKYMERLRKSAHPHKHYFRCKPTSENSHITITATDRFGRVFTAETSTPSDMR
jgi:hypothetical protein